MADRATTGPTSGSRSFDALRSALQASAELRSEVEGALRLLVDRVDPSDRGARFIVGSAAEWVVASAAWASGVLTVPGGHDMNGFDLVDLVDRMRGLWSVKSSFQPKRTEFRISNGMGGSGGGLLDPTVFLHPILPGLVFVDPTAHPTVAAQTRATSDAVVLAFKSVEQHAAEHPECVAELRVSANSHLGREDPSLAFTKGLLSPAQFPRLSDLFSAATPAASGSVAEQLTTLARLHATGALDDSQFELAKNRLLSK